MLCNSLPMFQFMLLEIRMMQQNAHDHFAQISLEHHKSTQHLEEQMKRLEQREKELLQREAQNETETRELHDEKKMVIYICPF